MHSTPRSGKGSFSERDVCVVYFLGIYTIFKCISPVLCTTKAIYTVLYLQRNGSVLPTTICLFLLSRILVTTGSRTAEKCSEIAEKCWKNAQKCRKNAQKSFTHVFYMRCFAGNLAKISKSRKNLAKICENLRNYAFGSISHLSGKSCGLYEV